MSFVHDAINDGNGGGDSICDFLLIFCNKKNVRS